MSAWLITGCSTGLGLAFSQAALDAGHNVVLVNNAGYGYRAAVEEGEDHAVQQLHDTHVHGAVRTIKAVLPGMRTDGPGPSSTSPPSAPGSHRKGRATTPQSRPLSRPYRCHSARRSRRSGSPRWSSNPELSAPTSGRSLTQSEEPISDYAETAGLRRRQHDTGHGTQPGDPAKAAKVLLDVVESGNAPYLLLLGNDASDAFRGALDLLRAEMSTRGQREPEHRLRSLTQGKDTRRTKHGPRQRGPAGTERDLEHPDEAWGRGLSPAGPARRPGGQVRSTDTAAANAAAASACMPGRTCA